MSGASSAGNTIFERSTAGSIAPKPAPTIVAPIRPPNRACDDELGRPKNQVARFQTIAPMRPANTITGVICTPPSPSRMSPPLIVRATSVLRNAPTRFSTAASATATFGRSAPVAIGVAMAFAVWRGTRWVKSKKRQRDDEGDDQGDVQLPASAAPPPPPPPENPPPNEPLEKLELPLDDHELPPLLPEEVVTIGWTRVSAEVANELRKFELMASPLYQVGDVSW